MFVSSNIGLDVYKHYLPKLTELYGEREASALLSRLFLYYTGYGRMMLYADRGIRLSESQLLDIHFGYKELLKFKPIQYIIGETDFYGLRFVVNNNVLIPRPETEELIEWIKKDYGNCDVLDILDAGTGSGCIAIALKTLFPHASINGIDISEEALNVAKENCRINGIEVNLFLQDIFKVWEGKEPSYDLIISNPPYICNEEKNLMKNNVLDYEPFLALFVPDDDPLIYYRQICINAVSGMLKNGGAIYFEINERFGIELKNMVQNMGGIVEIKSDLNGKERMMKIVFN